MTLELRHLRSFVTVAEELSFSAAARRLFVSQQALSRVIQQMERELGTPLFERTTRSVTVTPAGMAMLPAARAATTAAAEAFEAARHAGRDTVRPVRVDISSGGIETGALVVRELRRTHPHVVVEQVEVGVPAGLRLLHGGKLDVLLGGCPDCPADLDHEVLRREPVMVGMAPDHRLAARPETPVVALAGVPLLLPSDEAAREWVAFVADFCRQAGVTARRWPGVTHGSVSAAEVVREGRCLVPTTRWTDPPPDLVFRPLVDPVPVFVWSMVWSPPAAARRPEVAAFLAAARRVAAEREWTAAVGPAVGEP